jgi:aspartate aminotransferase
MAGYLKKKTAVDDFLSNFKVRVTRSLDTLYKGFQELKAEGFDLDAIEPMGAIYLTLKLNFSGKTTPDGKVLKDSNDINFYLIKEAKVALVPFSSFGTGPEVNWFRASVGACSAEEIEDMIPRIKAALLKLK